MLKKALKIGAASILAAAAMTHANEPGVTDNSILLGQSCALKGPAAALGEGMQAGLQAYFHHVNANGGVNGRTIELKTVNDGYEPDKCKVATSTLIEKVGVFALIGEVGTPTSKVAVPIAEQHQVPFIAPFTGAEFLRNPYKKFVVNVRGSYFQEMEALATKLVDEKGYQKIACFYQNDAYGQAGLTGIKNALERRGMSLCAEGTYERNTVAVAGGLNDIASSEPDAIICVGAYKSIAAFFKAAKGNPATQNADLCNISFVGTTALINEAGDAAEGSWISQVVPNPWDTSIPLVAEYQKAMKAAGKESFIDFASLEGYVAGKFFCDTLANVEGTPTREAWLAAVSSTGTFDFGGFSLKFGPNDHQGSDTVFLTQVKGGKAVQAGAANLAAAGDQ